MKRESAQSLAVGGAWVLGICGALYGLLSFTAADGSGGAERHVYKRVGETPLTLLVYRPSGSLPDDRRPCVIWFFGGGFESGSPAQFSEAARRLAKVGVVAITADYRVRMRHGDVTPIHAVKDARSAIRWTIAHADKIGVDPGRIALGGGSSGGHLALACATLDGPDETSDDHAIDPKPAALILFNPVVDFDIPFVREKTSGDEFQQLLTISPIHRIKESLPPCLILHGSADRIIPITSVEAFVERAKAVGSQNIELISYPGALFQVCRCPRPSQEHKYVIIKRLCG